MSGGLPEEKPWASCCPRSEATITLTLLPVCLLQAAAALFTANVSAGPELPIRAVTVTALLRVGEPRAAPTATASAQTVTTTSATRQRAIRVFRCAFTKRSPSLENEKDERAGGRSGPSGSGRRIRLAISSLRIPQRLLDRDVVRARRVANETFVEAPSFCGRRA